MPRPEGHPRISVIEDQIPMQDLYRQAIASFGFDPQSIQFISTADEARQCIHDPTTPLPNLVILDLGLRVQSGITVLKELKSDKSAWKDIPVLVVTVDSREEVRQTCLRLDAAAVIDKPFDIAVLQQRIQSLLTNT